MYYFNLGRRSLENQSLTPLSYYETMSQLLLEEVAATFRLRKSLRSDIPIPQAKACGYQNSPLIPSLSKRGGVFKNLLKDHTPWLSQ